MGWGVLCEVRGGRGVYLERVIGPLSSFCLTVKPLSAFSMVRAVSLGPGREGRGDGEGRHLNRLRSCIL